MKIKMRNPSKRTLYRLYKRGGFLTIRDLTSGLSTGSRRDDAEWQVLERLIRKGLVVKSVCDAEGKTVADDFEHGMYRYGRYLDRRMWYSLTEEGKKVAEPIVKKVDEIKNTYLTTFRPRKRNQRIAKNKKYQKHEPEEPEPVLLENIPSTGVVLIDFYTELCEPCKILEPTIWELEETFEKKVKFIKVDIEKNNEIASRYKVHLVPTVIIEKDGVLFKKYLGVTRLNVLEEGLNSALQVKSECKDGVCPLPA